MEPTISGESHRALQARPWHIAAIITLARARNVNPRSDELILERRSLGNAAVWESCDNDQRDREKTKRKLPVHEQPHTWAKMPHERYAAH